MRIDPELRICGLCEHFDGHVNVASGLGECHSEEAPSPYVHHETPACLAFSLCTSSRLLLDALERHGLNLDG
jgi:hypothetical protein